MILFLSLLLIFVFLFYKWGTSTYGYFKERGIPYLEPAFLLGIQSNIVTKKMSLSDMMLKNYNKFKDEK